MDVSRRRQRTKEILDRHVASRARYGDREFTDMPRMDLADLEGLMRETIRLLRENMAECVRSERTAAEQAGGQLAAQTVGEDLGYQEAKNELDQAIKALTAQKMRVRDAKDRPAPEPEAETSDPEPEVDEALNADRLIKLVDLHASGMLTADEFAAAKARLL